MTTTIAKASVAVMNATYEPLGATKLNRAMALVLRNEAVVEEHDETRIIRSIGGEPIFFPLVIRLLKAIHVPFYIAEKFFSKKGVLERDKHKCGYCGGVATTHDHIYPKSRGGKDEWMNSIAACTKCNGRKANRTPEEANMPLLFKPTVPTEIYLRSGKKPKAKKRR